MAEIHIFNLDLSIALINAIGKCIRVTKNLAVEGAQIITHTKKPKTVRFGYKVAEVSDCYKIEAVDRSGKRLKTAASEATQTFI